MNMRRITNEQLGAYLDGELTLDEREQLRETLRRSATDEAARCDLEQVKDWVASAYADVPLPPKRRLQITRRQSVNLAASAACAALLVGLLVGLLAGWQGPHLLRGNSSTDSQFAAKHIMLHIDNAANIYRALDAAEAMLTGPEQAGLRVRVITNGDGLTLLRADISPVAAQVRTMMAKYPNLDFVACNNSLRLLQAQGQTPTLIDHTLITPSAVEDIVEHLENGWRYIKV